MDKSTFDNLVTKVNSGTATEEELIQYNTCMNLLTTQQEDWGAEEPDKAEAIRYELWKRISVGLPSGLLKRA